MTESESLSAYVRRTGTTESDQLWISDRIKEMEAELASARADRERLRVFVQGLVESYEAWLRLDRPGWPRFRNITYRNAVTLLEQIHDG